MEKRFLDQLLTAKDLPSLPVVVTQVLALSNNSASSLMDYSEIIIRDVALSTQIIKLANSAYYKSRGPIVNVRQAVQFIGLSSVVPLIVVFSMKGVLSTTKSPIDLLPYWKRSVLLSCLSAFLSRYAAGVSCEEAMLAGLLQDIGVLAGCTVFPAKYHEAQNYFWSDHDKLITEENAIFGNDHSAVGPYLLEKWGIPISIANAALSSHQVPVKEEQGGLDWCVSGSNILASCIIRGIENHNLLEEVQGALNGSWLNVAPEDVDDAAVALLGIVSETESIFEVAILPDDIEKMLKYVSDENS
ncbi:MAG: HDOD domain-containing protein [Porticoccus sp.]|nr:HDOD domain-containing protein [Porticoccus sp.]